MSPIKLFIRLVFSVLISQKSDVSPNEDLNLEVKMDVKVCCFSRVYVTNQYNDEMLS